MKPRRVSKRAAVAVLCVVGAASGCMSTSYTFYEPTASGARFAPGHGCAGPLDLAIFPPELDGIQIGVVVNDRKSGQELAFNVRNDFTSQGLIVTDKWRERYRAMRDHVFDIYSPAPTVKVTFADGTKIDLHIPYLEGSRRRSYVAGKLQDVPASLITWPLPLKAADGFEVVLPEIFVDDKVIPTSPIRFTRTTKVLTEGINC